MYSESGTDGGSQFAGGGFVFSQTAAGANNDSSFSPASSKSNIQNKGLVPLTVKQLFTASQKPAEDNFSVDGQEVNNITLVGMIHNKEEKTTDVSFLLDDLTGGIEVKKWIDGQIDGQESEELLDIRNLRNGSYVRVHGHLRSFQGKRNVLAYSVRGIQDFNEVTFHFLECIYVHLSQTKGIQGGAFASKTPASAGVYSTPAPSGGAHTQAIRSSNSYNQFAAPTGIAPGGATAQECQRRVQAIFEEPASMASDVGLHRDDVVRRMVGFTPQQVSDAIEFLVTEGLIYSTIDDDHHKFASS